MKIQKLLSLLSFLFLCTLTYAQPWNGATGTFTNPIYRTGNTGVGTTTNPLSPLSVNGDGDSRWSGYFHSDGDVSGSSAIRAEVDQPVGFADQVQGITSIIEAGLGYTFGVRSRAFTNTPSSSGRAYGVYTEAGNATSGANYGVYSRLYGSNGGAAILGTDDVNFGDASGAQYLLGNKTWAGYFIGNTQVTNAMGIGCTNMSQPTGGGSQTYRLFVNGGIAAKALIIQNGGSWCDYVFEKDYQLTPLEEVAKHIEEKGHLHKTPSAAEIEANEGFEIGNITLNQQEKIEEIFLHLIEMNEQIEALKAENRALKATIATQK
jgi:hypothetical protein